MFKLSEKNAEELAQERLAANLPFFLEAFKIKASVVDVGEEAARICHEFVFPMTSTTLAIILGFHTPHSVSYAEQWDTYCNFCIKGMANFYIPFIDDSVSDVVYQGAPTSYVKVHKSKVYPSGRLIKRVIPQDVVDRLKEKANASS